MKDLVTNYFNELESSIEKMSRMEEGILTRLPSWILSKKQITILTSEKYNLSIIKVVPTGDDSDKFLELELHSNADIHNILAPMHTDLKLQNYAENFYIAFGDITITEENNNNAIPMKLLEGFIAYGARASFSTHLSTESAKEDALNFWNNCKSGFKTVGSYIANLAAIFDTFEKIIKRKSFLERRIHRYIDAHKEVFFPIFKNCYFDHDLFYREEKRVADFILELDKGFPAWLVELENPCHKVFLANGGYSAQTNHARYQIAEWVKFIEQDNSNARGSFSFLNGPKQRLVIIGRGLEHVVKMRDSAYEDAIVWTYDLFSLEAKIRCNGEIIKQSKVIGLSNPNLLQVTSI